MTGPALAFASIADLGAALCAGATTSPQATEACLQQAAAHDGRLNAFATVMVDQARAAAHRAHILELIIDRRVRP